MGLSVFISEWASGLDIELMSVLMYQPVGGGFQ
jgi:hypothetical protein